MIAMAPVNNYEHLKKLSIKTLIIRTLEDSFSILVKYIGKNSNRNSEILKANA